MDGMNNPWTNELMETEDERHQRGRVSIFKN